MRFEITRTYHPKRAHHWWADIREVHIGGGWEGSPVYGEEPRCVFAFTRIGLGIQVRRKCRRIKKEKREAEKPPRKRHVDPKVYTVDV